MSITYLFRALLKKKWLIIGITLIAATAAFAFTINKDKVYKSTTQIATGFTMNDQVKINDQGFDIYSIDLKFNNVVQTITSQQVINLVAYDLILHDLNNPSNAFRTLDETKSHSGILQSININNAKEVYASKLQNMQILSSFNPEEKKLLKLLELYKYDPISRGKMISAYRVGTTDYINMDGE